MGNKNSKIPTLYGNQKLSPYECQSLKVHQKVVTGHSIYIQKIVFFENDAKFATAGWDKIIKI